MKGKLKRLGVTALISVLVFLFANGCIRSINPPDELLDELEAGWTLVAGTEYDNAIYFSGAGSVKFTVPAGGTRSILKAIPSRDLSKAQIHLMFRMSDYTTFSKIRLTLRAPNSLNTAIQDYMPGGYIQIMDKWFLISFVVKNREH